MTLVMAYVILISAAVASCAVVGEMILRSRTAPGRWTWIGALAVVAIATGMAMVMPLPVVERPLGALGTPPAFAAAPVAVQPAGDTDLAVAALMARADRVMPFAWLVASLALMVTIVIGQRWLARERRRWRQASVNGRDVLVTDRLGPAVAGVRQPVVFVPQWVLALDHVSQELLLAHEFEHVKRGDTRLLVAGAISAALMPWNPVVWWMVRRLRLAVEQDCDARVLAAHPNVRLYADLLLTAASRHGISARLLAAHFGEHRSDLERRIKAMADRKLNVRRVLVAAMVAAGLGVVSCETPRPEPVAPGLPAKDAPDRGVSSSEVFYEFQVEKPVALANESAMPVYPRVLQEAGVEGEVLVSFVVDESGMPDASSIKVERSTHELFTVAVRQALATMRFTPAELGGRKVKQMVQEPFTFAIAGATNTADGEQEVEERRVEQRLEVPYVLRPDSSSGRQDLVETPVGRRETPGRLVDGWLDGTAAPIPNVIVYSAEGNELGRSIASRGLVDRVVPKSISSVEVVKAGNCAPLGCPLIVIRLAKGQGLSAKALRP